MRKMLIGSHAALHHFPDFPRKPKDIDYISEDNIPHTDSKFCPSFEFLLSKYPQDIAPPEVLYTLKVSHAFWEVHWDKTMFDIRFFQSKNLKLDEELYKISYSDCKLRYGKKRAALDKSNEDFFNDGVKRIYVHDSIHEAVAFYERPLYESIKNDANKAMTSSDLFDNLTWEDKRRLVKEEAYVTALERLLIPDGLYSLPPHIAYLRSLKLLITSMTKGWFAKFIVENYLDLSRNDRYDYVEKFESNEGKLKLI